MFVQFHGGAADAGSCALSVSIEGDFSLVPRQPNMHCRDLVRTRAWTVALEGGAGQASPEKTYTDQDGYARE
jgi:hypothetical protein